MNGVPSGLTAGQKIYLYVPNICNAACDFCHVSPTFGLHAALPERAIERVGKMLSHARTLGFDEVKVTGGEPLAFTNADRLFEEIGATGINYSVLTNGLELARYSSYFAANPPRQLMVSVHSVGTTNAKMFGVDRDDTKALLRMLPKLVESGIRVGVTTVVTQRNRNELERLERSLDPSVEWKVVRATDVSVRDKVDSREFDEICTRVLAAADPQREIRVSDTSFDKCALMDRSFFSVRLVDLSYTPCCVAMGSPEIGFDLTTERGMIKALEWANSRGTSTVRDAACGTDSAHCPLALRSVNPHMLSTASR